MPDAGESSASPPILPIHNRRMQRLPLRHYVGSCSTHCPCRQVQPLPVLVHVSIVRVFDSPGSYSPNGRVTLRHFGS